MKNQDNNIVMVWRKYKSLPAEPFETAEDEGTEVGRSWAVFMSLVGAD